jgi:hypothetical protein
MTATFRTKGLLSSQFLIDAEEIMLKGTIRGEHLEMDSVSTSVFEAIQGRILDLSAKKLKVDTDIESEEDFEVQIDENVGILVKKSGEVIFSINPGTGDAYFKGDASINNGIFRGSIESGPMVLNLSPPATSSYDIEGKIYIFLNNIVSDVGISSGKYACTGTYNSINLGAIEFTFITSYPTYEYYQFYLSGSHQHFRKWIRTPTRYDCSIKLYNRADGVIYSESDYYESQSTWTILSDEDCGDIGWSINDPPPSPNPAPATGGTKQFPSYGSISFTAGAYTFKLLNLPLYSEDFVAGTVYRDSNGFLKVKI